LHRHTFRIDTVKTARTIPMRPGCGLHRHIMRPQIVIPFIDLCQVIKNKSDMIQRLGFACRITDAVQCQIIITRGEINAVFIGTPFHLHAKQVDIKMLAALEIFHLERHMMHTTSRSGFNHIDKLTASLSPTHYRIHSPHGSTTSKS